MAHEQERHIGREALPKQEAAMRVIRVEAEDDGWLCPEAEKFLHDDIKSGEVCLVNDTFLMKHSGQQVGLAIANRVAEGGDIISGTWYGLDDLKLRMEVSDRMFWNKEMSITLPDKTTWRKVRKMRDRVWATWIDHRKMTGEELMEQAQQAAETIRNGLLKRS